MAPKLGYTAKINAVLPHFNAYLKTQRNGCSAVAMKEGHERFIAQAGILFPMLNTRPSSLVLLTVASLEPRAEIAYGELEVRAPGLVTYRPPKHDKYRPPALLVRTSEAQFQFVVEAGRFSSWEISKPPGLLNRMSSRHEDLSGCEWFFSLCDNGREEALSWGISPDRAAFMVPWLDKWLPPHMKYQDIVR